jgi:hypothetical protein
MLAFRWSVLLEAMLRFAETNPHIILALRWDTEMSSRSARSFRKPASWNAESRLGSMGTRGCISRRSALPSLTEVGFGNSDEAVTTGNASQANLVSSVVRALCEH